MTEDQRVEAIRAFNRFWTARIGVLRQSHLETPYSLTEARVIFELAQRDVTELAELRAELRLDPGYLSRIVARFRKARLVVTEASPADARRQLGRLTPAGRRVFELLNARSIEHVKETLATLDETGQRRLVGALEAARSLFSAQAPKSPRAFVLRPPAAGDLGWVVERHGAIYASAYGWDASFEGLVAEIVGAFAKKNDPTREAAWVVEVDGERAGSIFCVRKTRTTAQLRLLLVDPKHRGLGLGRALVDECLRFARRAGYDTITLWTNDVLKEARAIYINAGFTLSREEKHHSFGKHLVGQHWTLSLTEPRPSSPLSERQRQAHAR